MKRSRTFLHRVKKISISVCMLFLICAFLMTAQVQISQVCAVSTQERETIRVGYIEDPSYHYRDESGVHKGYDVEYLQEISQYTNLEYEYVQGSWEQLMEWIQNGQIDMMGFTGYMDSRKALMNYTGEPAGYLPVALYARGDNSAFEFNDIQAINGKRVGIVSGTKQCDEFAAFQTQNGIQCQVQLYDTNTAIRQALRNGTIDLGLCVTAGAPNDLKAVIRFKNENYYYVVSKNKPELLAKINYAMNQILSMDMDFNDELRAKYFGNSITKTLFLTKEEKQYIQQKKTLRVAYDPAFYPLERCSSETNHIEGISNDIIQEICQRVGLEYQDVRSGNYKEALELLKNGKVDILTCVSRGYVLQPDCSFWVTRPYLEAQMICVENRGRRDGIHTIALPNEYYVKEEIDKFYPGAQVVYFNSVEECMDAVASGKADATFANFYVATYLMSSAKFHNLNGAVLNNMTEDMAIGISKNLDPMLLSILNKGIESISSDRMNDIISEHTFQKRQYSALDMIYTNPLGFAITVMMIGVIIFFLLLSLLHNRQMAADKMRKLYYHDKLVDHGNYNYLLENAERIMSKNKDQWYAAVYADMVDFKFINDTYGYEEGDKILKEVGDLFKLFIDQDEEFARLYADHFVLLLKFNNLSAFDNRMEELGNRLEVLSEVDERSYRFLFHSGIYVFQQNELPFNVAVDYANYAKKTIPRTHENVYLYYSNEIKKRILKEKELELMMKGALSKEQFVPYFQPKVDVYTGEVVGAEALVRWCHPEKGLLSPGEFIPYFEKNGFVVKLDMYMYGEVCKRIRKWMDAGKEVFTISCNMSYFHVVNPEFPKLMKELTDSYGVPAELIELELTETVAVNNLNAVIQCGQSLMKYGFSVSIDDFGSGYSSISLLQQITVNVLKLDKDFVQVGATGTFQRDLVQALVSAVKKNDIMVVCEGIETREQEEFIKSIGCRLAQGYRYYKPMPDNEFEKLLKANGEVYS